IWEAGNSLADLAYTLQVGRDAMDERLGIVACSLDELEGKLRTFIADGGNGIGGLYRGQAGRDKTLLASFTADEDLKGALETWMRRGKFSRLLDLWVKGAAIDWHGLYGPGRPYPVRPGRISAPGYPFAEQRHWLAVAPAAQRELTAGFLHPLVQHNT